MLAESLGIAQDVAPDLVKEEDDDDDEFLNPLDMVVDDEALLVSPSSVLASPCASDVSRWNPKPKKRLCLRK